ncbi:RNA pol II accessory factor, Cdc73 family-domain-containing protein [Coniella lustricola]|uniref:RNA pol II accessory factor, Cdc73 family-domain-containing protein n=1 Tax=Coniella lustricola TaxID=2025994 RepID=A0A2T3A338_9PEZI|nr:RNA pol II accessory factor, Cdc73 family-domain-containing protein [Coniella lustricola]
MSAASQDALLLLRQSIAAEQPMVPVASLDSTQEAALSTATHLRLVHPQPTVLPLEASTRFTVNDFKVPVDLRSIYFAWVNRDLLIPEYNAAATQLNEQLAASGSGATVHKLTFVERVNLITWIEGGGESEYIKPMPGEKDAGSATTEALKSSSAPTAAAARSGRGTLDPRLQVIYAGERKMGDRNSILRGAKLVDFSGVRKSAVIFMNKKAANPAPTNNPALSLNQKPSRAVHPIILLSPSASSLIRLSNARAFLEESKYEPAKTDYDSSMIHILHHMRDIDANRPMRFILVESVEQFKPEYWNRVVAVFTTGQPWQFKNYKWSQPQELFRHVMGVHVGWRGEQPPDNVRNWGHRVQCFSIDKWREPGAPGAEASRFRDREVVEAIWKRIETGMKAKGWKRDQAPASI